MYTYITHTHTRTFIYVTHTHIVNIICLCQYILSTTSDNDLDWNEKCIKRGAHGCCCNNYLIPAFVLQLLHRHWRIWNAKPSWGVFVISLFMWSGSKVKKGRSEMCVWNWLWADDGWPCWGEIRQGWNSKRVLVCFLMAWYKRIAWHVDVTSCSSSANDSAPQYDLFVAW